MADLPPTVIQTCPGTDALRRFINDQLTDADAAVVDQHVHSCLHCQGLLEELVGTLAPGPPSAGPDDDPPTLDGYDVLGRLDAGGMGVVWRVRDLEFGRDLALKVIKAELRGEPELERRFLDEAHICGRLIHPAIVPVHKLGWLDDGRPYYLMKLVAGQTLATLLRGRPTPAEGLTRWLQAVEQTCQAVAFAHSRGVIHRDLKPANVMVGEHAEVQVMDWGLAKMLAGPDSSPAGRVPGSPSGDTWQGPPEGRTRKDSVLGTTAYMSPEQARGAVGEVDRRSDVFGLGAILCEVLTGAPPYTAPSPEALLRQAREADLADARARLHASGADPDLIHLTGRCLSPRREDRPADASEVASALAEHLAAAEHRRHREVVDRERLRVRTAEDRWRRKLWAALGVLAATMVVLTFLALRPPDPEADPSADSGKVRVGVCPWVGSAPLKVAEVMNLCDGIELEVVRIDMFAEARKKMLRDEIQAATCSLDGLARTCAGDKPGDDSLAVVLKLDDSDGGDGVVTRRPVARLADLRKEKGKRIAIANLEAPYYLFLELCHAEGLEPKDFDLENCDSAEEAYKKYVREGLDAVVTYEPFLSRAVLESNGTLFKTSRDLRVKIVDALVVDSRFLKRHPDKVRSLLKGWFKATRLLGRGDADARQIAYEFLGQDGTPVSEAEYRLLAGGLKFANPEDNFDFFSGGSGHNQFHRVIGHVETVLRRVDSSMRTSDLKAFDGSDLFLDMFQRGEWNSPR